jgi:lipopolysaccharide transport system ATP-binding protein
MAEALIETVRHPFRHRRRASFWALSDVSLDVAPGEVVGIIGRNGAGKSTLLKILSRITEPTAGEVRLRGRVGSLLEVGTGFHPELTGRENIYLNGAILGMKRSEIAGHFDSIVEFSGVAPFLDMPVKRYSSGMSVRLAFAVAAHLEPEIFVVDEVLAVGDAEFQRRCIGKMDEVAREDARTVLFVSHNMAAIEALCPRSIVLEKGRIEFDGPTDEAIAHYIGLSAGPIEGRPGEADLMSAPGREKNREKTHLRRVRLLNPLAEPVGTFRMGQPLTIAIEVEGLDELSGAIVGVDLSNEFGKSMATFHTRMKPARESRVRTRREQYTFDVGPLPLMPGRYWVNVGVWDTVAGHGADRVERAAAFDVVSADVYGSGYEVKTQEGSMFVNFVWEVAPLDDGITVGSDVVSNHQRR